MTEITIAARFCGPPGRGNGGYAAGLAAAPFDGAVEVVLRKPIPLDRALCLEHGPPAVLRAGDTVVMEARPTALALDVPPAPSRDAAAIAARAFAGFAAHAFPGCFVCGPSRQAGDGLRIFPGRVDGRDVVAAPWTPDASLPARDGHVRPEIVWAALDCAGYFAIANPGETAVLGRIAASVDAPIRPGEGCVVFGWPIARSGRTLHAGTAIAGEDGTLRGRSRQTWVVL